MKFPKLKHSVLCQLILYSPALPFFAALVLGCFVDVAIPGPLWIALFFGSSIFVIAFLIKNFPFYITSDLFFSTVRAVKKDALVFRSNANGKGKNELESKIISRCEKYSGRISSSDPREIYALSKKRASGSVAGLQICESVFVYSVDNLDKETYANLTELADKRFAAVDFDIQKSKDELEPVYSCAVIIIAKHIEEEIKELARKEVKARRGYLLPCVADCENACYYFDGCAHPHILGMGLQSEKNYCLKLIRKLVFGGKIPKPQENEKVALPEEMEKSLWEFISEYRAKAKEDENSFKFETEQMYAELAPGEVKMTEQAIYFKDGDQLAVCSYFKPDPECDEPNELFLMLGDRYQLPKKKMIPKRDIENIKRRIGDHLKENGYKFVFSDSEE